MWYVWGGEEDVNMLDGVFKLGMVGVFKCW